MRVRASSIIALAALISTPVLAAAPSGLAPQQASDIVIPPSATPAAYKMKSMDWIIPPTKPTVRTVKPMDWIIPPTKK